MEKTIQTIKVKCKYCGYGWNTRSQMDMVSCPSCLNKNKIPKELHEAETSDAFNQSFE